MGYVHLSLEGAPITLSSRGIIRLKAGIHIRSRPIALCTEKGSGFLLALVRILYYQLSEMVTNSLVPSFHSTSFFSHVGNLV